MRKLIFTAITLMAYCGLLMAYSYYTGYSGAPSSNGTCSRSCHEHNGFEPTCEITGFPEIYQPGHQYTITIRHNGGPAINQFNCSIRIENDSLNAGVIEAGENTETYSITNETNGVHWLFEDSDSGTFIWTAPQTWTGTVKLYWAGLQGSYLVGADQQIVIRATEINNNIVYQADLPDRFRLYQNYPNPFNSETMIGYCLDKPGDVVLEISNILGRKLLSISQPGSQPGNYRVRWNGCDKNGNLLPSGVYFYQLQTPEGNLTRKMTILR